MVYWFKCYDLTISKQKKNRVEKRGKITVKPKENCKEKNEETTQLRFSTASTTRLRLPIRPTNLLRRQRNHLVGNPDYRPIPRRSHCPLPICAHLPSRSDGQLHANSALTIMSRPHFSELFGTVHR
ncbi:unnamed protein product [Vicia faba]|uniref:Uncharacterized protein n=1 Tax=Vicia faba TaxID=3906 RepID=A0AAV1A9D9_VICFA|nr:unnamed protein product [Vicia faba]